MSHIDDLIKKLAPDGVQFKTLGDVGEFIRGSGLQKSDLTEDGAPAIHYGQIHTYYGTWSDTTKSFTHPSLAAKLRRAKPGDLIIATTSEDDAAVAKATAWIGEGEVAVSGDAYIYHHSLDSKYVSYFFQSKQFQDQKIRHITGTKVRRISGENLARIRIPTPPLEVQQEVVRVLGRFEYLERELRSELDAEVAARRAQYLHYRDSVLAFTESDGTSWSTFPEIAKNLDSKRKPVTRSEREAGEIPYYGASGIVDYVSEHIFDGDYLLVSEDGANLIARSSPIAFSISGKAWVNNHAHVLEFSTKAQRRFVEIYLNSIDLSPFVTGGAQAKLSQANLNRIPIPVPSIEEQDRVVTLLDQFKETVEDLSSSLSAERVDRRKQYEYYRDRLLTFKEVAA